MAKFVLSLTVGVLALSALTAHQMTNAGEASAVVAMMKLTHLQPGSASARISEVAVAGVRNPSNPASAQSMSAPAAPSVLSATVCGTWSLAQATSAAQLTRNTTLATSLATPGLKGLSIRVPWTAITSNLSVLDAGYSLAQANHVSYAVRFMAGVSTPSQFLGNSTSLAGGGLIPLPWGAGSSASQFVPNTVFENAFNATVAQLAAYSRAHGMRELHLPWYGGKYAELYLGPEIQAARGYSYQNFLTGHERLLQIAMKYAGPDLTVEFPFTGIGTRSADGDLANFILSTWGQWNADIVTQGNNLSDTPPSAQSHQGWAIYNGRQMVGMGDYNWANVYQALLAKQSLSVEIYASSFDPSLPHAGLLRSQVQAFASHCG